jgi:hypothetical protein
MMASKAVSRKPMIDDCKTRKVTPGSRNAATETPRKNPQTQVGRGGRRQTRIRRPPAASTLPEQIATSHARDAMKGERPLGSPGRPKR